MHVDDVSWLAVIGLVVITVIQHESGVILWYRKMESLADTQLAAILYSFLIVSVIDLVWLWILWLANKKAVKGLAHVGWIQRWIERKKDKRWFQKLTRAFAAKPSSDIQPTDSRFRRMLKQSGYVGIALCAALPGPGLKEVGILMAITPRYRRLGFHILYVGGLGKTIMTMLVYGGLYSVFERMVA